MAHLFIFGDGTLGNTDCKIVRRRLLTGVVYRYRLRSESWELYGYPICFVVDL
jgi:hypothetical protein